MERKVEFESFGRSLPVKILSTRDLVRDLKIPAISKFELMTGIKERRVCGEGEDSFSLAIEAAKDCLAHSRYEAGDIDMIINCSITKYRNGPFQQYEPAMSITIKASVGANRASILDISNACAGMLTGVMIAEDFISRGVVNNCLIVSGEFITGLSDHALKKIRTPLSLELASLTLGDAGAAVILHPAGEDKYGLAISGFTTISGYNKLCVAKQRRSTQGAFMKTKAKKIHEVSISESIPIVREALKLNGLSLDQIDYLIPHQTSKSAIMSGSRRYAESFGARPGQVIINLKKYGNTASTSHILSIYSLLEENRFKRDDRIMLLCFASGLIIGVVIFTMNEITGRYGNKN